MAKYPVSVARGKLAERMQEILTLHVPAGAQILDPTCGDKLQWDGFDSSAWSITFRDIAQGQDLFETPERDFWDAIMYDPPYFFGVPKAQDKRQKNYGGYMQGRAELDKYISAVSNVLFETLKPGGILIVKCSDQYVVKQRKFYCLHFDWLSELVKCYTIKDIMLYHHSHTSPTAFQVKNRPCCVIVHTYFLIAQKGDV